MGKHGRLKAFFGYRDFATPEDEMEYRRRMRASRNLMWFEVTHPFSGWKSGAAARRLNRRTLAAEAAAAAGAGVAAGAAGLGAASLAVVLTAAVLACAVNIAVRTVGWSSFRKASDACTDSRQVPENDYEKRPSDDTGGR